MAKRWVVKPPVAKEWRERFPQVEEIVLQLMLDRGINTQEAMDEFLNPDYIADIHDPFLFTGMKKAVARLFKAIKDEQLVLIYGDYDADGVSGSVILANILKELGSRYDVYLPHRDKEGYGLNISAVDYAVGIGVKVLITVDCGISNLKEIEYAQSKGIDVIVTDHHQQQEKLPGSINIHPKIEGENYPFKGLAGGGVAFKLAQGLIRTKIKEDKKADPKYWEGFEKWLLDMVAISTVADMMPLLGENRTLVKYGLLVMNKGRRLGLRHLLMAAGLWPAVPGPGGKTEAKLNAYNIGFQIAPRVNAAGRMNHANTAFKLFMAEKESDAEKLAQELNQNNRDRQALTEKIMKEAIEQVGTVKEGDLRVISVFKEDWPLGVAGLVAGKLVEIYHRPVIVMGLLNGKIAGSVRSISTFNFASALMEVKDLFLKFGGHPMAGGFTLASNDNLEPLRERLDKIVKRELKGKDMTPELRIDLELKLSQVGWPLIDTLSQFEPFGKDNPVPKFASYGVKVAGADAIGAEGKHLRLLLSDGAGTMRKAIGFGFGSWCEKIKIGDKIDVVYDVDVNEWNGNREVQLKVVDLKVSA